MVDFKYEYYKYEYRERKKKYEYRVDFSQLNFTLENQLQAFAA